MNNLELKNPNYLNQKQLTINDLQGKMSDDFYRRIQNKPNKQFYFELEYKNLNNPSFNDANYYPIFTAHLDSQLYTPQINNISMHMPEIPLLSQWEDLDKVCESYKKKIKFLYFYLRTKYVMIKIKKNFAKKMIIVHVHI